MQESFEVKAVITAYGPAIIQPRPNFYQFGIVDIAVYANDTVECTHRYATYDVADEYDYGSLDYNDHDILDLVDDKDVINKDGIICSSLIDRDCDTCYFRAFDEKNMEPMNPEFLMSFLTDPSIDWDVIE